MYRPILRNLAFLALLLTMCSCDEKPEPSRPVNFRGTQWDGQTSFPPSRSAAKDDWQSTIKPLRVANRVKGKGAIVTGIVMIIWSVVKSGWTWTALVVIGVLCFLKGCAGEKE